MYKVANASEYLVITGFGIKDVKVAKKAWILPGQSCRVFDLSPVNYTFEVQAMSADKLPFVLPTVFTIGPNVDDKDSLHKYAKLITKHRRLSHHMKELMQGIIAGETRVLLASMTMEELFRGIMKFKQQVFKKVQRKLNQFGLWIYNASMRLLVDLLVVIGHEYFAYLRREARMQANVDMVELVGGKLREWKTLPDAAMIDAKKRLIGIATHRAGEGQTLQDAARIDAKKRLIGTQRAGEGQKEEIKVSAEVKVFGNMREAKGGQKVFGNFALNVEPLQQV